MHSNWLSKVCVAIMKLKTGSTNALMVSTPEKEKKDAPINALMVHSPQKEKMDAHKVQAVQVDQVVQVVHHHLLEVAQVVLVNLLHRFTNALMVPIQKVEKVDAHTNLIHKLVLVVDLHLCTYAQMDNTLSLE